MTLWIVFAVVALPIILLSLKGLFVVATEGCKPPLPHTRGGFYTSSEIILEDEDRLIEFKNKALDQAKRFSISNIFRRRNRD